MPVFGEVDLPDGACMGVYCVPASFVFACGDENDWDNGRLCEVGVGAGARGKVAVWGGLM